MSDAIADPTSRSAGDHRLRIPKAGELIAARIRGQIARGELKPGEWLEPEPKLLETYGVGRPALREALRILEVESLISVKRGNRGGAIVQIPSVTNAARAAGVYLQCNGTTIGDIYEARLLLEPTAAARAADLATGESVAALREMVEAEKAHVDDAVEWAHSAVRFHEAVVESSGLITVRLFVGVLSEIINAHQARHVARPGAGRAEDRDNRLRASHAHALLVKLIEEHDEAGAERLWREHIRVTNMRYQDGPSAYVADLFP
jgi:DNA-binding FadR family transcriptional regulator